MAGSRCSVRVITQRLLELPVFTLLVFAAASPMTLSQQTKPGFPPEEQIFGDTHFRIFGADVGPSLPLVPKGRRDDAKVTSALASIRARLAGSQFNAVMPVIGSPDHYITGPEYAWYGYNVSNTWSGKYPRKGNWLWLKVVNGRVEQVVEQSAEYDAEWWSPRGQLAELSKLSEAEILERWSRFRPKSEEHIKRKVNELELTFLKERQNLPGMTEGNVKILFGQPRHDEANASGRKLIGYVLSTVGSQFTRSVHWLWIEVKNGRVTRVFEYTIM